MAAPAPTSFKASDLLSRVAPDRAQKAADDAAAKDHRRTEHRARFPLMAEQIDIFRAADAQLAPGEDPLNARPVFAANATGETWGSERDVGGLVVAGDKLAHLPAYEAFWRKFYGKKAETYVTYRERMQRAVKPGMGHT